MEKPSDTEEASSSKANSSSSASDPTQLVWEINGQYHVQCSEDEDSCDAAEDNPEEVQMNTMSELPVDDCNQHCEVAHEGGTESTTQARQRSRKDYNLLKWQTRQVAKAFVDNTINCVLEDMGFVPLSADTEDIINGGNLEHEAVSMAILSHGLQRPDHDTPTTSTHVDSSNSHSGYTNNRPSLQYTDGLSSLTEVSSTHWSKNEMGASCSFSSAKPPYQNTNVEVSCDLASLEDRIGASSGSVGTGEHSKTHLIVQSHSSKFSPGDMYTQPQADCDGLSDSMNESPDKLPVKSCLCSLPHKATPFPKETVLSPFHKRKAEDFHESTKRSCHESSSLHGKPETSHMSLHTSSTDESVSILYDKVPSFEHFDFMDAAVAVAIQKKGLSAMACTEYG